MKGLYPNPVLNFIALLLMRNFVSQSESWFQKLYIESYSTYKILVPVYWILTSVFAVCCVAKHCRQQRAAVQLSLNPPRARLPRLSAETEARAPKKTSDLPFTTKLYPLSYENKHIKNTFFLSIFIHVHVREWLPVFLDLL